MGQATPGRMVARGLIRHCARCGSGHLFDSWFRLRPRCPNCGVRFEREEGFWLGGYVINFASGEASIVVLMAVLIGLLANGQAVDVPLFVAVGVALALLGPMLTFPYSRTIWVAVDLIMRPLSDTELIAARADVAARAVSGVPDPPRGRRRRDRAGR
jgi:uncharacterized protein (DUF983 family)